MSYNGLPEYDPWWHSRRCKIRCFLAFLVLALVAIYASLASATLDSPYLGFNYDEVAGDAGWGLRGGMPFKTSILEGGVEATFQNTGDLLRGKSELEVGVPIGVFDILIFSVNTVKGEVIASLGRQNDIGVKIRSPEADWGNWHFTSSLGVFGRGGGVWASPTALSDLLGLGYTEEDFAGLGLDAIGRPSRGLRFKSENSVNGQLKTTLRHKSGLILEALLQPELGGAGDNPVHQFGVSATTSVDVYVFAFEFGLEWMFQTFEGKIENERAGFGSINIKF